MFFLACISLSILSHPIVSPLLSFLPLIVPETPGDEAALLPYSIMNEGSFQPAHSSLLQHEKLSCQPHSLRTPPSWPCLRLCVCIPRERWINGGEGQYVAASRFLSGDKWAKVVSDCVARTALLSGLYWFAGTLQRGSGNFFVQPLQQSSHKHTLVHRCPWEKRLAVGFTDCVCDVLYIPSAYLDMLLLFILELLSLYVCLSWGNIRGTPATGSALKHFHWTAVTRHSPPTLCVHALGNRVCLMCWKFHLTLLFPSPILLSSSLLSVASDCLQPPHFLLL